MSRFVRRETDGVEATERLAAAWAEQLRAYCLEDPARSIRISLEGELGAGKTAFVRGFVQGMDLRAAGQVSSPTYAILHVYSTDPEVRHLDLYRLVAPEELEDFGYRELVTAPGITLIEWGDRFPRVVTQPSLIVRIVALSDDARSLRFEQMEDNVFPLPR